MNNSIKKQKARARWKKTLLFIISAGILALILMVIITISWSRYDANIVARKAVKFFHEDKVESLLLALDSDQYSLREKNKMIEALGVLKDKRALPKLESLVTHKKCDHSREICQYGLKKSILKIKRDYRGLWQVKP